MLMQIYPAIDTWQREGAQEFVRQVRTVDPGITGSPVISYEASRLMEAAYFYGTLYAVVLVTALAVLMLRRPLDALLALSPVVLGVVWTIGFMHVFGLSFNLANVWGLPLIIGSTAEFGLNVTLRYREGVTGGGALFPRSAVLAVLLNGLTTIGSFGSLMVARHQGIFGLGLLLTVGTVVGLASSLIVLPVLLRLVERARLSSAANPAYVRKES
jgi:predicted RND superfamily exporter protein